MYFAEIKAGNTIINEGDYGDTFYMLTKGSIEVLIGGVAKKVIFEKDDKSYFGDLALLYNAPRSATIDAKTNCELWCINRDSF
jgi:cAMP-dependent protein kinase regulator